MTDGLDPAGESRHPLLQNLVPQGAAQKARVSELAGVLGAGEGAGGTSEELVVHRRSLPALTTQLAESLPAWAAGLKPERIIGPVRDSLGRDIWFDVFRRVRQIRFVRSPGAAPFLAVPVVQLELARLPTGSPTRLGLGAGSIWIATQLLAPAAGDGVYTGLRISGGTMRFGQPVTVTGDEVVVPAGVTCQLALKLEVPAAPGGTGPGQDVRDAVFQPPGNVAISIAGNAAALVVEDTPSLRLYGQDVALDPMAGAATYLAQFNRVKVPLAPRVAQFQVGPVKSQSLRPEGSASISGAGWALPAARINPADLGEASGVGALMLELGSGIAATWTGQADPVSLNATLVFLDEARLATHSAAARGYAVAQSLKLPEAVGRARVTLTWAQAFPLSYFAQASGTEMVVTAAAVAASLPKPVDVMGERISVNAASAIVAFIENAAGRFLWAQAEMPNPGGQGLAFGLTNAVLRASQPLSFSLVAAYDGTAADQGILAIGYGLFGVIPSLPDPYATNIGAKRERGGGRLTSLARWSPAAATLEFLLPPELRLPTGTLTDATSGAVAIVRPQQTRRSREDQAARALPFVAAQPTRFEPGSESGPAGRALGDALDFERRPRLILLDVSTNVSQFGVALRAPRRDDVAGTVQGGALKPVAVQGLDLVADGRLLVLLTLPAVQWEAVEAEPVPDDPAFPSRLGFANSGVPTLVDVPTVNLVPVTPEAVLHGIVGNFAEPEPRSARARFTLPFGMIASAILRKPDPGRGAKVSEQRPASSDGLKGGRQLRIDAVDPSLAAGQTPALPGFTAQLPVAIPADGSPGPRSILGTSVSNIFNAYLGYGGTSPLVPVTRIDLSGYGENLFSGWVNPTDDETQVSKAEFKVLVGRAAHEVVQVRSILLPYRVPVVRTITLERKNNAVITRHDSGWVAAGDGAYLFGPASGIVTHPGVVRRITNVTHIRETGDRVTKAGIEFAAVYYQGDLVLDGAAGTVPVARHFGYVKIGTMPLTPAVYAALLAEAGPLCGPLDTTIAIGGGPVAMRLHRVGVGVTPAASGPEFVMAAWGALVFPGGGEWSVLQAEDAAGAPQPVPQDEGLPLIRAGAADGPPPTGPYRFADPADLARESTPERDYGILHATGTQRAFFRRPRIEAADLARIVSTERPVIADPYVLATALGPFPLQSNGIPLPPTPWALAVGAGGHYRLETAAPNFAAGIGRRTVRQAGSVRSDLDYTASVVTYEVDTAQPVPWRFALTRVAKIMSNTAMGDLITLTSDIAAAAGRETTFDAPNLKLGGALSIVEDLLTILADLGIAGVLQTAMTNEWSLKAAMRIPFADAAGKDLQVPPLPDPLPTVKFVDTGVKVELAVHPKADSAAFEIGGSPSFAIKSVPGLYVVAIIKFKIKLSTEDGTTYELLIGLGLSYEIEAGPFELKGLLALTFFVVWGDTVCGYGVGFLVKVSAAIEPIVSVELTLEGRLARITVNDGLPDETVFAAAKLIFAIEVSIFLVLNISVEYETTQVNIIRGPLPETALPDVL